MALNINPVTRSLVIGGLVGGGASVWAATHTGDDSIDSSVPTYVAGGLGATGGAWFAGRYLGPQIQWTRAEHALHTMQNRQLKVFMDLKTGSIVKYDQERYLRESAEAVQTAKSRIMSAAAPKKAIIAVSAAVGAAVLGYGMVKLFRAFDDN